MKKYRKFIVILVLVCLAILYYFNFETHNKKPQNTQKDEVGEVQKLINKDLEKNYPASPREVVRMYSRIITCFYGEKYSEDEKKALSLQARILMDSELLQNNPFEQYYEDLTADIEQYKNENKNISTYILDKSSDVIYKTLQSKHYASLNCVYYVKGKSGTERTIETYTLRKDESGKWKILYWKLTPASEENE